MTDLEKISRWLESYPGWREGEALHIDYTDSEPCNGGLFPIGLEEVSRREDLLGNVTLQCRYRFNLYRVSAGEGAENAQWLMDFQQWVQQQSAAGLAPRFGDVLEKEWIRAEKGKLQESSQVGTSKYAVTLTAEFIKKYNMEEQNGKN